MKLLLIDDEPKAVEVLRMLLEFHLPEPGEVRVANSGPAALKVLEKYSPDLIFLDVEMPGMDGFDFLQQVKDWNFDIIFVTAYDQYAIKAIRYAALDYLLKPVDPDELVNAVARHRLKSGETLKQQKLYFNNLLQNLEHGQDSGFRLSIGTLEGTHFIAPEGIVRCEADGSYTHIVLKNKEQIMASRTLADFEQLLDGRGFLRIHKSHLVNLQFVQRLHSNSLILKDLSELPVARRRKESVLKALKGK